MQGIFIEKMRKINNIGYNYVKEHSHKFFSGSKYMPFKFFIVGCEKKFDDFFQGAFVTGFNVFNKKMLFLHLKVLNGQMPEINSYSIA
jgi:hypothetical protein